MSIEIEKDFLKRQIEMDRQLIELQDRRIHTLQAELDKRESELKDCCKSMREQWKELNELRYEQQKRKRKNFLWF